MKFVHSRTDFLVDRVTKAVRLPADDPFHVSTQQLVELMRKKQEEGSWIP